MSTAGIPRYIALLLDLKSSSDPPLFIELFLVSDIVNSKKFHAQGPVVSVAGRSAEMLLVLICIPLTKSFFERFSHNGNYDHGLASLDSAREIRRVQSTKLFSSSQINCLVG